jgi:hypothetical protein
MDCAVLSPAGTNELAFIASSLVKPSKSSDNYMSHLLQHSIILHFAHRERERE